MTLPPVAAVVLAAGASRRLGRPKQLIRLGDENLLERSVRVAIQAGCSPVVVILGSEAPSITSECRLEDAIVVVNQRWAEGMATSIQAALERLDGEPFSVAGAILMVCDQPAVTPAHLRSLMASGQVTASEYACRRGVPAYVPASSFPELMKLSGDAGARGLLCDANAIELPGGELDIDTESDLAETRQRFGT